MVKKTKGKGYKMKRTNCLALAFATLVMLMSCRGASDISPEEILEKVASTYESMQTYKSEGKALMDVDTGDTQVSTQTSFSISLKKPNLYLITWGQKDSAMPATTMSGAAWNDGTQPYSYVGLMNAYSKMESDEMALAGAMGVSGGSAFTIPSLFLAGLKGFLSPLSRLDDPKIEKTEKIGDEDCYVISGSSVMSKKETLWISKSRNLIMKYSRSLETPEKETEVPEMTDEQLEMAIEAMGQDVTEESKENMRKMMNSAKEMVKNIELKGSITESHNEISSPELDKSDFQYTPPEGTVLKDNLFEDAMKVIGQEEDIGETLERARETSERASEASERLREASERASEALQSSNETLERARETLERSRETLKRSREARERGKKGL